jgi:hypothetical protein
MNFSKKYIIGLLLPVNCFCQQKQAAVTDVIKATFLNPGISYEKKAGKCQTLYAQAFLNTSFGIGFSSYLGSTSFIYLDPAFTLQYRYYYNFAKREDKGKRTALNSLDYIAAIAETIFSAGNIASSWVPEEKRRAMNTIGLVWGIQRNYPKRFSIDANAGFGYLFAKETTINTTGQLVRKTAGKLTYAGQLNLGFWLNRK